MTELEKKTASPTIEVSSSIGTGDVNEENVAFESRKINIQTILALLSLAVTYEAVLLSFAIPINLLYQINLDIGPDPQYLWILTSWSLANASTQTVSGRLSDIFGRRYILAGGNLFALIGCIVGATAKSVPIIVAGMVLIGVGAGAQQISWAAANELVPKRHRAAVLGFMSIVGVPGTAFSAIFAQQINKDHTWRWGFYVGVIIDALALLLIVVFYWPPSFLTLHPEGKTKMQQFKEIDFIGVLLFGGGLLCTLLGLSFGNNPYPWSSAIVLGPLITGLVVLFFAFPAWEIYAPSSIAALCPPRVFRNIRGFTVPICVMFVGGMLTFSAQALWPQQIQTLFTTDPVKVGWYAFAFGSGATVGAITGGFLFTRIKHTRWQLLGISALQTLFTALMATVDQYSLPRAWAFIFMSSLFASYGSVAGTLYAQYGVENHDIGLATGLAGSIKPTGGGIATAIFGSVLASKVNSDMIPSIAKGALAAGLPPSSLETFIPALLSGNATVLDAVEGTSPLILEAGSNAIKTVYAAAFKNVAYVGLAFGVLQCAIAVFNRGVDDKLTNEVAASLEKGNIFQQRENNTEMQNREVV